MGSALLEGDPHLLRHFATTSGFDQDGLRAVVPYLLALHDLGKFSNGFQDQRPDVVERLLAPRPPRESPVRHDSAGYALWRAWGDRRSAEGREGVIGSLFPMVGPEGPLAGRDLDDLLQPIAAAVLGHHGKPPRDAAPVDACFPVDSRARTDAVAFARAVREVIKPTSLVARLDGEPLLDGARRASWWLAGFTILCDWVGSNTRYFSYRSAPGSMAEYWACAQTRAVEAVRSSGLLPAKARPFTGIGGLFPGVARTPTPLQAGAAETDLGAGPQLFILEDLTGAGKTEAALLLAQRLMADGRGQGFFFALPTMATANAMDGRVQPLLDRLFEGPASYLLSHSGPRQLETDPIRLVEERATDEYGRSESETASAAAAAWLSDSRKKALLADAGVGTIDQALMAVLQNRHSALRLFGLHRRVLIIDEVHACDAYMHRLLRTVLAAHAALGGSAILLSATLPLGQRGELADAFLRGLGVRAKPLTSMAYPLLTSVGSGRQVEQPVQARQGASRRVQVAWLDSLEDAVAKVAAEAEAGRCACWVRNSVADAVEAYDLLASRLGEDRVTLFHARFTLGDRLRIEHDVVGRFGLAGAPEQRRGHIVVATQVVEQSLDIDFDAMVTDLCPVDLAIQRAGRLQRHPARYHRPDPVLHVLAPPRVEAPSRDWLAGPFRRTAVVYPDPGVLWRTAMALDRLGALDLPAEARKLLEEVYGDPANVPEALGRRAAAAEGRDLARESTAAGAVIKLNAGYLREGNDWPDEAFTPTRLGEPTVTLRLAKVLDGRAEPWAGNDRRLRWAMSEVRLARRLVAGAHPSDAELIGALEADQPFVGPDVCTVPLWIGPDGWEGHAVAVRGYGDQEHMSVRVTYSETRGLQVSRGS